MQKALLGMECRGEGPSKPPGSSKHEACTRLGSSPLSLCTARRSVSFLPTAGCGCFGLGLLGCTPMALGSSPCNSG